MNNTNNIKNKNDTNLVVISAFLDIGREIWKNVFTRKSSTYVNSFLNYLNYDNKMIIFIDDMYINEVKEKYEKLSYKNKIFIPINKEWMSLNIHAWQQLETNRNIMNSETYKITVQDRIKYNYPENICPEYNAINHAKIDFICYAIKNNYISKNDFICWSDFGYFNSILHNNINNYPNYMLDINKFNVNKLSFCLRNKLNKKDEDMVYTLTQAPEKFTGSFFAGSVDLMLELQKLYHISLEELYANNISDDDQHVYLRCYLTNPSIFELYLSDNEWPKALKYFEKKPNLLATMDITQSTPLCEIMGKYNSDKGNIKINDSWHNYTTVYYSIFKNIQMNKLRIFELGLGTNNINIPSNMGINGSPGASLYGWSEFFINSDIFGADIDKNILFNTDKIKTFFCDQTNADIIRSMWNNLELKDNFDIIIEDGLHSFNANVCFFENSIHKLKPNGYYIIEAISNSEKALFIEQIKKWKEKYFTLEFNLLDIPSKKNKYDNILLVIYNNINNFNLLSNIKSIKNPQLINTEFNNKLTKFSHIFYEIYQTCNFTFCKGSGSYLFDGQTYKYCDLMYEKQVLLYNSVKNAEKVLEIGTYMGHSLLIMLLSNPKLKITCIDISDQFTGPAVKVLNKYFNNAITFICNNSLSALKLLNDKFDFFHVDGYHENDYINEEFKLIKNLNSRSDNVLKIIFDDQICLVKLQHDIDVNYDIIKKITPNCEWNNVYYEISTIKK